MPQLIALAADAKYVVVFVGVRERPGEKGNGDEKWTKG